MIHLEKNGTYSLFETFEHTKILSLDDTLAYAWIHVPEIGDILVTTHKKHNPSSVLSAGAYNLYDVRDEPNITDLQHLELYVGGGIWQGYLLPRGLPNGVIRHRIIPTTEIISRETH